MLAEVKVLVEGYTGADSLIEVGEEKTQPTITLIRDGDTIMVVDPGILESQQVLINALKRENLTVDDVNIVCITHSHLDHYRNVGMFPNAKVLEFFGLWEKNTSHEWPEQFSNNIRILKTPGHDYSCLTFLVKTNDGIVAICGDVFWKENYPEEDIFASDKEKLEESRKIVLKLADWIVPGHAKMYKNDRNVVLSEDETPKKIPKNNLTCKKCGSPMKIHDICLCRPYMCFRCCECGYDCPACGCSHKK